MQKVFQPISWPGARMYSSRSADQGLGLFRCTITGYLCTSVVCCLLTWYKYNEQLQLYLFADFTMQTSLVPRPLPDFISQPWWRKIRRRPGIIATSRTKTRLVQTVDVAMIPGLLLIFLHGCEIKSGSGLGTRLYANSTQHFAASTLL